MKTLLVALSLPLISAVLLSTAYASRDVAIRQIVEALQNREVSPGAVIASPSKTDPDYFYHWVRDGAITMIALRGEYQSSVNPAIKSQFVKYLNFTRHNQSLASPGEPKFLVNGEPYKGPWGRPQNDGPALRAISLILFAQDLLTENKPENTKIIQVLYEPKLPAQSAIKIDLEYISHHWREASFDPWEESMGDHFFNWMVQRKALVLGSVLAKALGDGAASSWYLRQAQEISVALEKFFDPSRKLILTTLNRVAGIDYKSSQIDSAVILGVLLGELPGYSFSTRDPRVLTTARIHEDAFYKIYAINQNKRLSNTPGTAMGRYPEDRYTGVSTDGQGNPWFLTTLAYSELCYRVAQAFSARTIERSQWTQFGDKFYSRAMSHSQNQKMSEQINRESGAMQGAYDLTWSYGAELLALQARARL